MPSLPMSLFGILFFFHLLSAFVAALPSICQSTNHNASATGRPVITYALSRAQVVHYIHRARLMAALERAVDDWARVIPFAFAATDDYDGADVKVAFFRGDHGEGFVFRPHSSLVSYSELLPGLGYVVRFNRYKRWSVYFSKDPLLSSPYDLESVFRHEMGKVLGLGESTEKRSVMYPSISDWSKQHLTQEDAVRVQALCGSNPNFDITTLPSASSALPPLRMSIVVFVAIVLIIISLM